MELVEPRNLLVEPVRSYPPGRIYEVIVHGFGLMPGYGERLDEPERWAIAAYVQALQLSQAVPLDALPGPVRARVRERLEGGR